MLLNILDIFLQVSLSRSQMVYWLFWMYFRFHCHHLAWSTDCSECIPGVTVTILLGVLIVLNVFQVSLSQSHVVYWLFWMSFRCHCHNLTWCADCSECLSGVIVTISHGVLIVLNVFQVSLSQSHMVYWMLWMSVQRSLLLSSDNRCKNWVSWCWSETTASINDGGLEICRSSCQKYKWG